MHQKYVKDNTVTVQQFLDICAKKIGKPLSIRCFWRWKVGQSIKSELCQSRPIRRILLKLSGEALMGSPKIWGRPRACHKIATSVQELSNSASKWALSSAAEIFSAASKLLHRDGSDSCRPHRHARYSHQWNCPPASI